VAIVGAVGTGIGGVKELVIAGEVMLFDGQLGKTFRDIPPKVLLESLQS
jgi:hypothetical protein